MDIKIERRLVPVCPELSQFPELLQRIYSSRRITCPEDLEREFSGLLSFADLLNIESAVQLLVCALQKQQHILIVGDFDVDGATSTTLALLALRGMGAGKVSYMVPNRFKYGYGLSPEIVDDAALRQPDLIITVDNGISSCEGVARARELGIDVLITDHHLAGKSIPQDCIIVNPNQADDKFASKNLAGVGVIFYVMLALRAALKQEGWFSQRKMDCPKMSSFLDLVALGTVADVVPLDKNNRILVYQGLKRIRAHYVRPGILALMEIARRQPEQLSVADFGFALAPRLNAAGRLDDMSLGIECLLAEDMAVARKIAHQLDQLNHERKALEAQMKQEAFDIVDNIQFDNRLPNGLSLYEPNWHQGIVGLVASRVKDKVNRPVIAFAKVDETTLKGSARSIAGLHIRDVLDRVATQHPHLISKFGGHAMAAGLSIPLAAFDDFVKAFEQAVTAQLDERLLQAVLLSDGELTPEEFTLSTAELLREGGPWGQGFPEPVFDGVFEIAEQRIVGGHHLRLTLKQLNGTHLLDAIAFNVDLGLWPNYNCAEVQLSYRLDVNEYRGKKKMQLIVQHLQVPASEH